jgi:BMFP domain-containing protein YqiC
MLELSLAHAMTDERRELDHRLHQFWQNRLSELEAAEKQPPEPQQDPTLDRRAALTSLDQRVASLTESAEMVADHVRELHADLDSANAKIEKVRKWCAKHKHVTGCTRTTDATDIDGL